MQNVNLKIARTPRQMLEVMGEGLAEYKDPWARHWLILSSEGSAEWVRQDWAQRCGIASRSQVMNLRTLLESPLYGSEGGSFSLDRLILAIAANLSPKGIEEKALTQAKFLAEALDVTLLARPLENAEGLKKYLGNSIHLAPLTDDSTIMDILKQHIGLKEKYEQHCKNWITDWKGKGGFPKLWITLNVGVPQTLWTRLNKLLECCPKDSVELIVLEASEVYWADLKVQRKKTQPEDHPGPLLKYFGKRLQDLHWQISERFQGEGDGGEEFPFPDLKESLLGRLQACCREVGLSKVVAHKPEDHSFEIHSARNPFRELEVVRDRILQAMAEDKDLKPQDISVLLTDPSSYGSLVMGAFQPQEDRKLWIPFSLSKNCIPPRSPFKDSLRNLLKIVLGRVQKQDLMELVEDPLIVNQFNYGGISAEVFQAILEAYFSWGVDAEHRNRVQNYEDQRWSLRFAMERLALGNVCSPEDRDRILPMGISEASGWRVPLERFTGLETSALAGLASLIKQVEVCHGVWNAKHLRSVEDWTAMVEDLVLKFLSNNPNHVIPEAIQFPKTLAYLKSQVTHAVPMTARAYLKCLEPLLQDISKEQETSGGVHVGSLQQDYGLPTKMLIVVGLSADTFPRSEDRPHWHPLANELQVGDPSRREDDRHFLLMAILACSDRCVLTYLGGSDTDDRECPPSTPLSDLIDVGRQCCGLGIKDKTPFWFYHGLNGFSPQSHAMLGSPSVKSYSLVDRNAHEALMKQSLQPLTGLWEEPYLGELPKLITRKSLNNLLREAPKLFLAQLNLYPPQREDEVEEGDRLTCGGLEQYLCRKQLLQSRISGLQDEPTIKKWKVSGAIPPNKIGEDFLDHLLQKMMPVDSKLSYTPIRLKGGIDFKEHSSNVELELGTQDDWYMDNEGRVHYFCLKTIAKIVKNELVILPGINMLSTLIDFMCIAYGKNIQKAIVHTDVVDFKLSINRNVIKEEIFELVKLCLLAHRMPLPHWKETYEAMLPKNNDSAEFSNLEKEIKFREEYGDSYSDFPPPSSFYNTRLVYRGCPDIFDWSGPVVDAEFWHPFAIHPGESLALKVFDFIRQWEIRNMRCINA